MERSGTLGILRFHMSYFLCLKQAARLEPATADSVLALSATLHGEQACGAIPVNGLLVAARRRGLRPELIDLRNSGDTAGDKSRVVGYAAFAFTEAGHDRS